MARCPRRLGVAPPSCAVTTSPKIRSFDVGGPQVKSTGHVGRSHPLASPAAQRTPCPVPGSSRGRLRSEAPTCDSRRLGLFPAAAAAGRSTHRVRTQVCARNRAVVRHRRSLLPHLRRTGRPSVRRPGQARAQSVPIRRDNHGQQWLQDARTEAPVGYKVAGQRISGHASAIASQADSASSILVTRSRMKAQVIDPGLVCCPVR